MTLSDKGQRHVSDTELEWDEARRVEAIVNSGILTTPPAPELQAVVELAASICGVRKAALNIITDVEQHSIVTLGFPAEVCAHEDSMCAFILREDAPVVVPNALVDDRFKANPNVTGVLGNVRFYAAHKLITRDGFAFGTLCVFDDEPHELDAVQTRALGTLAERIVGVFELTAANRELQAAMGELEATRARLERSNDRLLAFAGQITHDLKTPLTTMSLSIELLRDELEIGATNDEVLPLITRALSGSARMTQMIEDVLAFARLGTQIDLGPVDLQRVVEEVCDDLAMRGTTVKVEFADLPVVLGDDSLLRALIQNLITNGAKFHAPDVEPALAVAAARDGDVWRIEVSDNGIGVPDEHKIRIFDPMVRLDKTYEGVGIGLSTCMRVVDAHEGRIGVIDNPAGQGSTFWVEIPA